MDRREHWAIYIVFLLVYVGLIVFNLSTGSQWFWDALIAAGFLTFMFFLNKYLKLGKTGFLLFNAALLCHNLGSFGFYEFKWGVVAYDNLVHLLGGAVAAYIVFNYIARKLHMHRKVQLRSSVLDENLVVMLLLVIAGVAFLGVVVELVEFAGYQWLGPGEGILFVGAGDASYSKAEYETQYEDTMEDIIVNLLGASIGVVLYYHLKYKKKIWLKKSM
ncbi:hypothetical protein KY362_03675 [Candidatus Woesearchaeota archaeon]|nr:hypothetical protein [Candidatus Woesearchaeota archaeon]